MFFPDTCTVVGSSDRVAGLFGSSRQPASPWRPAVLYWSTSRSFNQCESHGWFCIGVPPVLALAQIKEASVAGWPTLGHCAGEESPLQTVSHLPYWSRSFTTGWQIDVDSVFPLGAHTRRSLLLLEFALPVFFGPFRKRGMKIILRRVAGFINTRCVNRRLDQKRDFCVRRRPPASDMSSDKEKRHHKKKMGLSKQPASGFEVLKPVTDISPMSYWILLFLSFTTFSYLLKTQFKLLRSFTVSHFR